VLKKEVRVGKMLGRIEKRDEAVGIRVVLEDEVGPRNLKDASGVDFVNDGDGRVGFGKSDEKGIDFDLKVGVVMPSDVDGNSVERRDRVNEMGGVAE
jgi:hypothetical protein